MSDPVSSRLNAALEGRYVIDRELGEGGMATVYLADDLRHERKVALKVLKPELAAVVGAERFLAEIKTTANLQHPHILPLHDSGEVDSFLFYVMPYVAGETLRGKIEREKQLGVKESLNITQKIANALDYAHGHGVVHRDIKPANILLSEQGEPLIADFGIALAVAQAGGGRITETGLSLGTPYYMSPEQATGDRDVDPRSDVYALGCVLYEMLAGAPPFSASSAQAVWVQILTSDAPRITTVRRTVPRHVESALARVLEKLPADRFASAAEFASALGDESFDYRPRFPSETVATTAPGKPGKRAWITDPRSVAALVGILLLGVWGRMGSSAGPAQPTFRLGLDLGGIIPDPASDLAVAPDGSALAVVGRLQGEWALRVRRAEDTEFRPVATTGARYPAFSPDGAWIVYRNYGEGTLEKVSTAGGAPLTVLPAGFVTNPRFPHWGDDGSIVFVATEGLFRIADTGGEPELLREADESELHFPRLLPGARAVLLTDESTSSITLLDLTTDSLRVLLPEGVDATYVETGHLLYGHPDGGLFAAAFDLETMEVTGQRVPLLDDVSIVQGPSTPARAQYSVSKNGTLVYQTGRQSVGVSNRLLVVPLEGASEAIPLQPRDFVDPRWSPDGGSVAYSAGGQIYVYDVDLGTIPRQLTFEGTNSRPVWSPDGTRIAFSSRGAGTDGQDLFVKTVDTDQAEAELLSLPGNESLRDWAEGDVVAFEYLHRDDNQSELWTYSPSGAEEASAYLVAEADLDDIAVSPDRRWAAYQSNETGTEEVYVRSFPVAGQQIPISEGGGQFPRWSPDGRTIYYWRAENAAVDTLYAARVTTQPTLAVVSRAPVITGSYLAEDWDLHPDGDRIVVVEASAAQAPQGDFLVVVNWFEELRARLGR